MKTVSLSEGLQEIEGQSFLSCKSLEKIDLPESVQSIGSSAFIHCDSLNEIKFPSSMEYLGRNAFEGCTSLEKIKMPDYIKEVQENVFEDTIWLRDQRKKNEFIIFGGNLIKYTGNQESVVIPSEVRVIARGAVSSKKRLKEVTIPSNVEYVAYSAIEFCNNLETVYIEDGVGGFGNYAFYGANLKKLVFEGSLPKDKGQKLLNEEILPQLTLYAPAGSDVEKFAIENQVKFQALDEYGNAPGLKNE